MKKTETHPSHRREPNGFALGFLLGAGLVFLLGTKEGRKIKDQLAKKGQKAIDELPDFVQKVQVEGRKFSAKAKAVKEDLDERVAEINQQRKAAPKEKVKKRCFTRQGKKLV